MAVYTIPGVYVFSPHNQLIEEGLGKHPGPHRHIGATFLKYLNHSVI